MITDRSGILVYVNPAWTKIYGYSSEEAIGQTPRILRSQFQAPDFYSLMWKDILDEKIGFWKGEIINRVKDGRLVTVLLTITPYRGPGPNAEIQGYMGIAVDLTAQKEMELKVLQQDRLASVGQVASGLAHEVGTPLGVMRGRAELLAMQLEPESAVRTGIEVIISQIDRISKLLSAFLHAARAPTQVNIQPTEIEPLIQEVVTLTQQQSQKFHINVEVRVEPNLMAKASSGHLLQVLLNLAINSVHAIEKQREIAPNGNAHAIKIIAREDSGKVIIKVSDTGCGIAPWNMSKLFQPFFTTKDVGRGTGLGLAISNQLMNSMGGQITVDSPGEGLGATFIVTLPLATT